MAVLAAAVVIRPAIDGMVARLPDAGGAAEVAQIEVMVQLGIVFAGASVLILAAVRGRAAALALDTFPGIFVLLKVLAGMAAVLAGYNGLVYTFAHDDMTRDLMTYAPAVRSPLWLISLAVIGVIGPVCEELLFRGFLLASFAQTALRFRGAAFLTTFLWVVLHAGYTTVGLVEVSLIGFYFCWVMWRWGSLWLTILAHGIYNSLLLLGLRFLAG